MLRWFWWRINAWSEIAGMFGSLFFFGLFFSEEMSAEERMIAVAVPTIIFWVLVTLATQPEPMETLRAFYKLVRPGGPGWKPVAAKEPKVIQEENFGLSILGAILASGIVYCLLYSIGKIIFKEYSSGSVGLLLAGLCAVVVYFIVQTITSDSDSEVISKDVSNDHE